MRILNYLRPGDLFCLQKDCLSEDNLDLRVFVKLPVQEPTAVSEQVLRLGSKEIIHLPSSERVRRLILTRD